MTLNNTPDTLIPSLTLHQRVPLAIYNILVVTLATLGNGVVLWASLQYNAVRLDKVTVFLVRNLALADILYTLIRIVPHTVNMVAGNCSILRYT